jgi:hypothetical protein
MLATRDAPDPVLDLLEMSVSHTASGRLAGAVPDRVSGDSSRGSIATVAGGPVAVATGSGTGGSIRTPRNSNVRLIAFAAEIPANPRQKPSASWTR